ncbi:hypothetical protein EG829_04170 [bacterium]|nr:hypothetical protein [bacterium]
MPLQERQETFPCLGRRQAVSEHYGGNEAVQEQRDIGGNQHYCQKQKRYAEDRQKEEESGKIPAETYRKQGKARSGQDNDQRDTDQAETGSPHKEGVAQDFEPLPGEHHFGAVVDYIVQEHEFPPGAQPRQENSQCDQEECRNQDEQQPSGVLRQPVQGGGRKSQDIAGGDVTGRFR